MVAPRQLPDQAAMWLDDGVLAQLAALVPAQGEAFLLQVLTTFASSLTQCTNTLADAARHADWAAAGNIAHSLKSSSASVGAHVLSARCAELEKAARVGPCRAELEQVLGCLPQVLNAVQQRVLTLAPMPRAVS